MGINRYAARIDSSQTRLITQLRGVGIQVWSIRKPCDLLTRFWCNRHHDFCWEPLEVKTASKTGRVRVYARQAVQTEFIRETGTAVVTSFETAWTALNRRHSLAGIEIPGILNANSVENRT